MLVVVALGGNALLQRGETLNAENQRKHAQAAAQSIAEIAKEHQVVLCHGNGPQVGLLAQRLDFPFDSLVAQSQGMIGYVLQQTLKNALPNTSVITLLTQTIVDEDDPAFQNPTKFIGAVYDDEAELKKRNVPYKRDGNGFRRVIASPAPKAIIELESIKTLLDERHIVICNGGGGIPVIEKENKFEGAQAVIDKDASSSLLAQQLGADRFIILTDVDHVYENFGSENQRAITQTTARELSQEHFTEGSMGPKVKAACSFTKSTGNPSSIGRLTQAKALLDGTAGTQVS